MMTMNLSSISILKTKDADYCCVYTGITRSEAINSMQNIDLAEKTGIL